MQTENYTINSFDKNLQFLIDIVENDNGYRTFSLVARLNEPKPYEIIVTTDARVYLSSGIYNDYPKTFVFAKGETEKRAFVITEEQFLNVDSVQAINTKIKQSALEKMYSETQTQYANGKETATIRCSIGDYYDENGKKYISTNFIQEGILPNEYQEVEYIESTGTQYIDTGVIGESGISSKAKVMWREQSSDSALLGSRKNNDRFYLLYQYPLLSWNIGYGENFNAGKFDQNVVYTVETFLDKGVQSISIDDNVIYKNYIEQEIKTDCSIYLFDINKNGSPSGYRSKARIYSLTMKKNETIIRDFIPCYRKSDGLVGLWDKVTNKFYTNDGAGLFLKGNNAQTVKPISTKLKMSFDIGDIVIPMVFGVDGNDRPMSLYNNGNPKKFQVLGKKMFYDGAVWQGLSLQEV
jgi:hypothetical protein